MSDHDDRHEEETAAGYVRPEPPTEQASATEAAGATTENGARRLLRSRDDRMVAGVSGGLGRYFNVDPVIVRIAFAVSILFGGFGIVAYLAAAIFVPADDGTGAPAPASRARSLGRIVAIGLLVLVACGIFGGLVVAAAFVTGLGYGLAVVAAIVAIGLALLFLSFRGGARWLIVPALALSIGAGTAAAADLDLSGGIGQRDNRPTSAAAIPSDGYELGVGQLAVDLRTIDWKPQQIVRLHVRVGAGQATIAVPSDVCVVAAAHVRAGEMQIAGQRSEGWDVDSSVGAGSTTTPRLELDADVDFGQIRVLNDDSADIGTNRGGAAFGDYLGSEQAAAARAANVKACAG